MTRKRVVLPYFFFMSQTENGCHADGAMQIANRETRTTMRMDGFAVFYRPLENTYKIAVIITIKHLK